MSAELHVGFVEKRLVLPCRPVAQVDRLFLRLADAGWRQKSFSERFDDTTREIGREALVFVARTLGYVSDPVGGRHVLGAPHTWTRPHRDDLRAARRDVPFRVAFPQRTGRDARNSG